MLSNGFSQAKAIIASILSVLDESIERTESEWLSLPD